MQDYRVLIHPETYQNAIDYLDRLKSGEIAGKYLNDKLKDRDLTQLSIEQFFE